MKDIICVAFFSLCLALMATGVGLTLKDDISHREKLIQECMADGHKEYECEGMLK